MLNRKESVLFVCNAQSFRDYVIPLSSLIIPGAPSICMKMTAIQLSIWRERLATHQSPTSTALISELKYI